MSAPLTPAVRSWQRGCLGRGGTGQARCLAAFQPLRPGLTRLGQGGWGLRGVLTPVWQLFAAGCGRGLGRNTHVAFLYGLCTWGSLGFFTTWWPQRSQIACVAPRTRTHSSQGRKPLMICPWKSHASLPPSGPANHKGAPGTKKREHRLPPQYDELLGWEAMRLWPRNEAALPFMSKLSQPGSPKKPPLPQVYLGVSQRYSISHCRVGITSVRSHACCPRVHGTGKFTEQVKMLELHGLLNQLKTDS